MPQLIRINKLLSQLGVASRRKADEMISQARISINSKPLSSPGVMVDPKKDKISVDGNDINTKITSEYIYIMLHKPQGHITTLKDTHQRRTVMDLVPKVRGIFPIGRLDKDTTGLLVLTNDGELSHRLMHPSYKIGKIYEVAVSGAIKRPDIKRIEDGVGIGDDRLSSLKIVHVESGKGETIITVNIHEGRKRQIRRTFEALGYKIKRLQRTVYAGLKLDIKEGSYRYLAAREVTMLKKSVGLR